MAVASADSLSVFFLPQDEQTAASVMARLTAFIAAAQETLEFALYDLRLSEVLKQQLAAALQERARGRRANPNLLRWRQALRAEPGG